MTSIFFVSFIFSFQIIGKGMIRIIRSIIVEGITLPNHTVSTFEQWPSIIGIQLFWTGTQEKTTEIKIPSNQM